MAGQTGYSVLQNFSLAAGASITIDIPECAIIYFNIGGGGTVFEVVKKYNAIHINNIFNSSDYYYMKFEYVDLTQIKVTNPTNSSHFIRYKYINLKY